MKSNTRKRGLVASKYSEISFTFYYPKQISDLGIKADANDTEVGEQSHKGTKQGFDIKSKRGSVPAVSVYSNVLTVICTLPNKLNSNWLSMHSCAVLKYRNSNTKLA